MRGEKGGGDMLVFPILSPLVTSLCRKLLKTEESIEFWKIWQCQ